MKKLVLTYGLIAGIVVSIFMLTSIALGVEHMDTEKGMYIGFTGMIIALSFIFVAIKNYRDKHNGGTISFGKAFRIGLYISLIASTLYVISWMVDYYFFVPDFLEKYAAAAMENVRESGASEAEISAKTAEMAQFREWYKNPVFVALLTYTEILPVGIVVSLIAALFLKRNESRPDIVDASQIG